MKVDLPAVSLATKSLAEPRWNSDGLASARFGAGFLGDASDPASLVALAAWIKDDLRERFARGDSVQVADYLGRFPQLAEARDRVVSLVYEEFCLREEQGEQLDPDRFCDRYEPWRDSVASQLRYHRLLSQVVAASPAAPRFPAPGETFQGYPLVRMLGRGGMARVYLARDTKLFDRPVVLKVSPDLGHESQIQGRLDHDNIVPIVAVTPPDPASGLCGLCMPYRPGSSLDEVLRQIEPDQKRPRRARALWDALRSTSPAEWEQGPTHASWRGFPIDGTYAEGVAWIVMIVARALEYAHGRDVLHRDIKPGNVLLTFREGPQLLDFNLAHAPHDAAHAEVALRGGTLPYMAPEQLEAFLDAERWGAVGKPADLYSLGLLLCELLTGRRPEPPDPNLPLPRAIRDLLDRRALPTDLRRDDLTIAPALASIASKCLAFHPADRYASAGALAEDLGRYLERLPLRHAPNPSRAELARNWGRRHRVRLTFAACLIVVASAAPMLESPMAIEHRRNLQAGRVLFENEEYLGSIPYFEAAIRADGRFYLPHGFLGQVAEKQKLHADAIGHLDKAIPLAHEELSHLEKAGDATEADKLRKCLAMYYWIRSNSATNLGHESQKLLTDAGFHQASDRYKDAARDAEAAERLLLGVEAAVYQQFLNAWATARAEIGLGDVDSHFQRIPEAVEHYTGARASLDRTFALWGGVFAEIPPDPKAAERVQKHRNRLEGCKDLELELERRLEDNLRDLELYAAR